MPLLLVLLFIVVPIAELALLIQVGQLIGVWWTSLLLIADAILGSWLLRTQSRAAWLRFNEALAERARPAPRGHRRRAGHLRRRAAAHAGLHHRHLRAAVPVPAHARAAARAARAPRRAEADGLDADDRDAAATGASAARTTSRAPRSTSTPTSWTRRGERGGAGGAAFAAQAGGHGRRHVLLGGRRRGRLRARAGRVGRAGRRHDVAQRLWRSRSRAARRWARSPKRGRRRRPRSSRASRSRWSAGPSRAPASCAFSLTFEALTPPAEYGGRIGLVKTGGMEGYEQLCRVRGTMGGARGRRARASAGTRGATRTGTRSR